MGNFLFSTTYLRSLRLKNWPLFVVGSGERFLGIGDPLNLLNCFRLSLAPILNSIYQSKITSFWNILIITFGAGEDWAGIGISSIDFVLISDFLALHDLQIWRKEKLGVEHLRQIQSSKDFTVSLVDEDGARFWCANVFDSFNFPGAKLFWGMSAGRFVGGSGTWSRLTSPVLSTWGWGCWGSGIPCGPPKSMCGWKTYF